MFMGEYHHSIDNKGRLTIPSKFRDEIGDSIIVTRGIDNCLFIYTEEEWQKIISKYKELPNTKDARNFLRVFLSGASTCELDKQSRVNINPSLIEYASLDKECVIIGVVDRLEIWSKNNWIEFLKESEQNLSDLAEELFKPNMM